MVIVHLSGICLFESLSLLPPFTFTTIEKKIWVLRFTQLVFTTPVWVSFFFYTSVSQRSNFQWLFTVFLLIWTILLSGWFRFSHRFSVPQVLTGFWGPFQVHQLQLVLGWPLYCIAFFSSLARSKYLFIFLVSFLFSYFAPCEFFKPAFAGVWATVSLFRSPGPFSVFWSILAIL